MNIIADTHTHTSACQHAYSTLIENVTYAKKIGLKAIANTEHGPTIPGAPHYWFHGNQKCLPRYVEDVLVLRGCEANIIDFSGSLDITEADLVKLDWVIASFHEQVITPGTVEQHTNAYLTIARNPHVDVIGHCGDERFRFDYEAGVKAFKEQGKIVEINSHSFAIRPGSKENCRAIALLCKQYEVPIVISSDAHFCTEVGSFDNSIRMLREMEFPQELILNADWDRFFAAAAQRAPDHLQKLK